MARYQRPAMVRQRSDAMRNLYGANRFTPRTCLRCGKEFPSLGPGNRRCGRCQTQVAGEGRWAGHPSSVATSVETIELEWGGAS